MDVTIVTMEESSLLSPPAYRRNLVLSSIPLSPLHNQLAATPPSHSPSPSPSSENGFTSTDSLSNYHQLVVDSLPSDSTNPVHHLDLSRTPSQLSKTSRPMSLDMTKSDRFSSPYKTFAFAASETTLVDDKFGNSELKRESTTSTIIPDHMSKSNRSKNCMSWREEYLNHGTALALEAKRNKLMREDQFVSKELRKLGL